ncbi:MAG: hypothetical protein JST16_11475 [Bdellovibrionales bacterium]|nr:hypothetical protein [Bdellovibrionales bacterium]
MNSSFKLLLSVTLMATSLVAQAEDRETEQVDLLVKPTQSLEIPSLNGEKGAKDHINIEVIGSSDRSVGVNAAACFKSELKMIAQLARTDAEVRRALKTLDQAGKLYRISFKYSQSGSYDTKMNSQGTLQIPYSWDASVNRCATPAAVKFRNDLRDIANAVAGQTQRTKKMAQDIVDICNGEDCPSSEKTPSHGE